MSQTAKLFANGRSQAVRLPAAFRFEGTEVFIRHDPASGDVILSKKPDNWDGFIALLDDANLPGDLLNSEDRDQQQQERDPFAGWSE